MRPAGLKEWRTDLDAMPDGETVVVEAVYVLPSGVHAPYWAFAVRFEDGVRIVPPGVYGGLIEVKAWAEIILTADEAV